jgi:tripartite-type tricarboxylate transporter receptor subunit TctC
LPEVPSIAETYRDFSIDTWWGLVAPAGLPPSLQAKLHKAFSDALASPEVKTRFSSLFAEPAPSSPDAFAALMASELKKYEAVVKASGAKVD